VKEGATLRCAPWTLAHDPDPVGTAGSYDNIVLVAIPLPWPAEITNHPWAAPARGINGARVLAIAPPHLLPRGQSDGRPPVKGTPGDGVLVVHWERATPVNLVGHDHLVPPGKVPDAVAALAAGGDAHTRELRTGAAPPEVLVCAHGRRDVCCGRMGTLLATEVAGRLGDHRVWRCSHTGGHRFAPTGITLPDGRAWGYLDAGVLEAIATRSRTPGGLRRHYRGATGLDHWAQAVEAEVLTRWGWSPDGGSITGVVVDHSPGGTSARVRLDIAGGTGGDLRVDAAVEVARRLPIPDCGEVPTGDTRTWAELRVVDLDVTPGSDTGVT